MLTKIIERVMKLTKLHGVDDDDVELKDKNELGDGW